MSRIDDEIRAALTAEDRELARLDEEQGILRQVSQAFQSQARALVVTAVLFGIAFMAFAVVMAVHFFEAETVRDMLIYGLGFGFASAAIFAMKIWYWMEMQKNSVVREVKRVELQVAKLARALGARDGA